MSDYQLLDDRTVLRIADNAFIPFDERNRDYQAYLEWVSQGNQPLPLKSD